jgi:hypothetical protein
VDGDGDRLELWPLVGRGDEVDLAARARRRGRAVVLAGAAGVGKTRLARAALADATAEGRPTRWVAATRSARTVPLGAFAHLLPAGLGPAAEGQDPRPAALAAVVRAIEADPAGPPVVGIDDAHLLDDVSATLVHRLACNGTAHAKFAKLERPRPEP